MAAVSVIELLRQQISTCEAQLASLRQQLAEAEHLHRQQQQGLQLKRMEEQTRHNTASTSLVHDMSYGIHDDFRSEIFAALSHPEEENVPPRRWPLENSEYKRYGRQLIMPEIGLQGQLRLKQASVLIVGVGGLGCPAAAYLVGAGVGTVGLIDGDVVEESNLHRQILHSTARVGMTKVDSAIVALSSLNPNVNLVAHPARLTPESSLSIMQDYDLVLDCTDNPASRYLISDTCVLLGKPLVSASALRTEGQLMVLNNPPLPPGGANGGPCYRCIFPKPPAFETVVSCGEGGILGPVVGTMGVLQALETIKVLSRGVKGLAANGTTSPEPPTLTMFSAYGSPMFRTIRLRGRRQTCASCGAKATVTPEALKSGSLDYALFCGSVAPVDALTANERISVDNYAKIRTEANPFTGSQPSNDSHILIDVREGVQFDLCSLEGSVNIPFSEISRTPLKPMREDVAGNHDATPEEGWVAALRSHPEKPIFVICRLGNDSQLTVKKMKALGLDNGGKRWIGDIKGGLRAWRENVDQDFPDY
ncbi:molybdopterin biosynthesis protein moeB [Westerdykella ornata]|uniref:Adenylyltransferase and sulfurtransferase uba4 n=1 Tax=Westerdykella ornata TaxID=318751 RepID=A0A6A6JMS9_WESOR|nr:molybdopterin biosynthesis protein moeB [Westerdykella ornata]KAF2277901.1 molybdopterin biosynthesis protein moeB [Westerdykella ornata]